MKSPELPALKAAERFIQDELRCRELSYLPNPTDAEYIELGEAQEAKRIVQAAIVSAELRIADNGPDLLLALTHLAAVSECFCGRFSKCYRCEAVEAIAEANKWKTA